jgi:branched-subunit amino acid aminotransferase/4-amino-4-deoxychorismate lyase
MSGELASLDGLIAPAAETMIPVTDEGLLRGDGVFEVIRVYDGVPFALKDHLVRLDRSTTNLRLGWNADRAELERDISKLLAARGGRDFDGCLRIVLTRGGRRLLLTEPMPAMAEHVRLAYVTYSPTRVLDGVKSLSYAANMLTGRIARERGFDEALLVTPHGRVLEAPTSTLFWVAPDGTLATPPLDEHILASITRQCVIDGTGAEERICTQDDLAAASEAFLASTIREVQPIARIEDIEFEAPGERTQAAAAALRERIEEALRAGG